MTEIRISRVAYLVPVLLDATPRLLLNWHKKWEDWSLVGGKLEPGEDFTTAAMREAKEELAPLAPNLDFTIYDAELDFCWRAHSPAMGPTHYQTQIFYLRFLGDVSAALLRLPQEEFATVDLRRLERLRSAPYKTGIAAVVHRVMDLVEENYVGHTSVCHTPWLREL